MGKKKQDSPNTQQRGTAPDWPALKPLLSPSDLSLFTLVESQIVLIRKFWTQKLCQNYVSFLGSLPLTTTPGKPKKGEALRVNDRFEVMDDGFANRLWLETGLKELICGDESNESNASDEEAMDAEERSQLWGGQVIGLNPRIRIYRYTKGQYFDCHYDESNLLILNTKPSPTPAKTTWTLLLYLSSPATGCEGGQTVFYPEDLPGRPSPIDKRIVVDLEVGTVLLHKHGDDCMLHEGREVIAGEKWVIRSDLCIKR